MRPSFLINPPRQHTVMHPLPGAPPPHPRSAMQAQTPFPLSLQSSPKGIEILAITAGIGNGWQFSPAVLRASLPLWEQASCYADHTTASHSVRDLGGILENPSWDEQAQGIRAVLKTSGPAARVFIDLAAAAIANPALPVGLSADILMQVDGRVVQRILKVRSLDAVTHPARGGRFIRVLQSKGTPMTESTSITIPPGDEGQPPQPPQPDPSPQLAVNLEKLDANARAMAAFLGEQERQAKMQAQIEASDQVLAAQCGFLLNSALIASRLPEVTQARLHRQFENTVFQPAQLQSAIDEARAEVTALTAGAQVQGPGRISGMFNTEDQLQAAVDDLFGAERDADKKGIKVHRLQGVRELYLMLTGDYDLHGGYDPIRAQFATTADFTGLVKNALNKVVVNSFERMGRAGYDWWKNIVQVEHFENLQTITGTLVGTIGSLPEVAEQGEYTELAVGDSPETASFTKYGGYLPLTLEAIDRDETRKLRQYAVELGNAAMRNISAEVAEIFTSNSAAGPTMADGGALFNATAVTTAGGHANLLTTALGTDYTAWNAVALAVYNQPMLVKQAAGYYGTGKKLAIDPKFCLVPRALKAQAEALFLPRWEARVDATATAGGPTYGGHVVPVTVPEWTDATDWAAVCDPTIAPAIIVGERFGLVPEIYIAGRETDPAVFMNDEHRLKVRQFLAVLVGDFRPLHKSNVA